MQRRLFKFATFSLAGAALNVAVAWACALWSPVLKTGSIVVEDPSLPEGVMRLGDAFAWGIGWKTIIRTDFHVGWATIEAGLPLHAVSGEGSWVDFGTGPPSYNTRGLIGWQIQGRGYSGRMVKPRRPFPIQPLWIGFLTNTGVSTALLWLSVRGVFLLRRHMRIKRGLCPLCVYPTGSHPVCTECGTCPPVHAVA